MTLKDDISSDFDEDLLRTDEFAETLTYNVHQGASTAINYVPGEHEEQERVEEEGRYRVRTRQVIISSSASKGIVSPDVLDTVTIDAEEWDITGFIADFVSSHKLDLERRELIKRERRR